MNSAPSELIQSSLNNNKIEFERKREEKVEGILLRSKANWHENGEKCSQYFCKLEKKKLIKKTITELIDDAGHHISDQSKILLQQHDFYKTLYSTTNLDCNDESFFNHNIKLTEEQKYLCEGNITFTGYWTRAIKRFALFDLLKSLYSDTNILSKYIPSLQK